MSDPRLGLDCMIINGELKYTQVFMYHTITVTIKQVGNMFAYVVEKDQHSGLSGGDVPITERRMNFCSSIKQALGCAEGEFKELASGC